MINIKMGDLYDGYKALIKLSQRETSFGLALSIADIIDNSKNKVIEYEKQRTKIIEKYAKRVDDNKYRVLPEKIEEFTNAMDEIFQLEFTLPVSKISVERFGDIEITAEEVSALRWLIET